MFTCIEVAGVLTGIPQFMKNRTFVGVGFGAIQGGLFLYEAFRSGNFDRLVVAEVLPDVVAALRRSGGRYRVNIATPTGLEVHEVTGIEALNPKDPADRVALLAALGEASEICTALPNVDFFSSIASLLAEGLRAPAVIYTAENNNHAAELLEAAVRRLNPALPAKHQFLNTVIGKMSGVVTATGNLAAITDGQVAYAIPELKAVGLSGFFDPIIVSGNFGYRKPDKRLFTNVLNGMKMQTSEVLFVGNDMYRDVFGAQNLGMKAVFFKSNQGTQEKADVNPDYIIYNFPELLNAVRYFEGSHGADK